MKYCIDTSTVIDAGERYYPVDVFPGFWTNLDQLAQAGRLRAPDTLIDELQQKSDAWRQWVYDRQHLIILPVDDQVTAHMAAIVTAYKAAHVDPGRLTGDPFFIATALEHDLVLITSEKTRPGGAKIPAICKAVGVTPISLMQMCRAEGWQF